MKRFEMIMIDNNDTSIRISVNLRIMPLKAVKLHVYNVKVLIIGRNGMRKIILSLNSYLR